MNRATDHRRRARLAARDTHSGTPYPRQHGVGRCVPPRRERKKIEMLFAHLKRILKLDRLRLRGPNGAKDESRSLPPPRTCASSPS